jgi:hypothetical protein
LWSNWNLMFCILKVEFLKKVDDLGLNMASTPSILSTFINQVGILWRNIDLFFWNNNGLKCYIWVQFFWGVPKSCHNITLLYLFYLVFFLPCKDTFMDDYDGIYNCNSLEYNPSKFFDNFWFIIFYGDQNIG